MERGHSTLDGSKLHGFCRTHRVCRSAKSDAAGDGVGDMKETANVFADDISEDPGRDDGGDGDGDIAAELFGKSHADGRGDGLWKQRHVGSVVKAEGQAEDVDGKEPCHDAGKDTEEDGLIVFLQTPPSR